jgi:hypothetical protein
VSPTPGSMYGFGSRTNHERCPHRANAPSTQCQPRAASPGHLDQGGHGLGGGSAQLSGAGVGDGAAGRADTDQTPQSPLPGPLLEGPPLVDRRPVLHDPSHGCPQTSHVCRARGPPPANSDRYPSFPRRPCVRPCRRRQAQRFTRAVPVGRTRIFQCIKAYGRPRTNLGRPLEGQPRPLPRSRITNAPFTHTTKSQPATLKPPPATFHDIARLVSRRAYCPR